MNRLFACPVFVGVLLAGCGQTPVAPAVPPAVGVVAAQAGAEATLVSYVGTVSGDVEVELTFKLGGRLELIGAAPGQEWREGDPVAEGAVVARLDPSQLTEAVRAAEARAKADAAAFERGAKLVEQSLVSRQDFDVLTANRDASAAQLAKERANLDDAVLRAPFAATVLRRSARAGETVAAGAPVLRVADLRRVTVELGVPEQIVGTLKVGTTLSVSVSALRGERLSGLVHEVGASALTGTRLFRLLLKVDNASGRLRPGMSATVSIPGNAPPPGAVTVPLAALRADADGRRFIVFVVGADRIARQRLVEVVDVTGSAAVVSRGLSVGETVVSVGAGLCADGLLVDPRSNAGR